LNLKEASNYLSGRYLKGIYFIGILLSVLILCNISPRHVLAASFGYTDDGTNYVINTGSKLVFKVNHNNGDIVSLVYNGTEYEGYQGKNSHVQSGLGASTVSIAKPNSSTIVVTVIHGTLKQYYVARSGENNIYMFTYKADDSVNALRYIVRLKPNILPNVGPDNSNRQNY
jgi:rhamnogalacturonan endolyase